MSYRSVVENGVEIESAGFFFKGLSFQYESAGKKYDVRFQRSKKNIHSVVYALYLGEELLEELTHPDYVVEKEKGVYFEITELSEEKKLLTAVMVFLEIARDRKTIEALHFVKKNTENQKSAAKAPPPPPSPYSFTITQPDF